MPEPLSVAAGAGCLVIAAVAVAIARVGRLRRAMDESAAAIEDQRDHLEALRSGVPGHRATDERIVEAEDRLAAVGRLHAAQVHTWNSMGRTLSWRLLRPLTRWQPITGEHRRVRSTRDPETARP